jgi:hypothetical protein
VEGGMRRVVSFFIVTLASTGCLAPLVRLPTAPTESPLPAAKEFRNGQIVYHSDADVSPDHQLFVELASFPEHVCRTLGLPPTDQLIHVYLFRDRAMFEEYFRREFKDLPSRRALFVLKRDGVARQEEPRVYAFWGDRIHDDLRHELTHATLHGVLHEVPLWLDEGLAMYFEGGAAAKGRHTEALDNIAQAIDQEQWKPDLNRLAGLEDLKQLRRADYHEAWAWVHHMLHSEPERRTMLLKYLQVLRRPGERISLEWGMESFALRDDIRNSSDTELLKHLHRVQSERSEWPHP